MCVYPTQFRAKSFHLRPSEGALSETWPGCRELLAMARIARAGKAGDEGAEGWEMATKREKKKHDHGDDASSKSCTATSRPLD